MGKGPLSRLLSQNLQLLVMKSFSKAFFVLCIVVICTGLVAAQTCSLEKLQAKAAEIENELLPRMGAVRLHRLEELEDNVFVRRLGSHSIESPFFLYQIEQRRFYLKDGEVVENPTAGPFSQYVGISQDAECVYRLAGFPDAEDNFKRLVADYHLPPPHDPTDAQSRALFCARAVFGQEPQQWILDEAQAQMRVSSRLSDHRKNGSGLTTRWWRDFRRSHPNSNLNLITRSAADGTFLTRLPLFWAPVESDIQPEIRELQIQVNRDGSCHRVSGSSPPSSTAESKD
jgi:hypothetical protein